jgi:hypothetical protein
VAITDKKDADETIWVTTLVSSRTREGVVEFTWGEKRAQLSVQEARDHALVVLECAEAAETDAFLVHFLENELKMDFDRAVGIMRSFRSFREQRLKERQH